MVTAGWLTALVLTGLVLGVPAPGGACSAGAGGATGGPVGSAAARLGLVFAGGGAKAAYEAGVALALHARGIVPAAVAGTSSGAINAALVAAGEAERLASLWRGVRRDDVYGLRAPAVLGGLLPGFLALHTWGASVGLLDSAPLRQTLTRQVDLARIRSSPIHVLVIAADLRSGAARRFDNASLSVDALVASATVPGLFPAVALDGDLLVDGGVVQRAPTLELLDAHPLDRLLVISAYESDPPEGTSARATVERAIELALTREVARDVELARYRHPGVDVRLLRPSAPLRLRPLDFEGQRLGRLVDLGQADGARCLDRMGIAVP